MRKMCGCGFIKTIYVYQIARTHLINIIFLTKNTRILHIYKEQPRGRTARISISRVKWICLEKCNMNITILNSIVYILQAVGNQSIQQQPALNVSQSEYISKNIDLQHKVAHTIENTTNVLAGDDIGKYFQYIF